MPTMRINDINLYYEEHGSGRPLLFIHGLGSSSRDWAFQVVEFAQHFRVITLDLRGHGQSDKPRMPYTLPMLAADVAGLLAALDIDAAIIIGLSLGGSVALQLALDSPSLVEKLIIVNSAPEWGVRTLKARWLVWQRLLLLKLFGMRMFGRVLSRQLFPKPEQSDLRTLFIERWAENDKSAYQNALRALLGWSVQERLGAIQVPTLVLTADHDYISIAEKRAYCAHISNGQLRVIPDSHHALPVESPQLFNQAVWAFLSSGGGSHKKEHSSHLK